jgi:hypothetical protein
MNSLLKASGDVMWEMRAERHAKPWRAGGRGVRVVTEIGKSAREKLATVDPDKPGLKAGKLCGAPADSVRNYGK